MNKILNIHGRPLDHLPTSTVTVYITVAVIFTGQGLITQVWLESGREWVYTAAGRVYSWSGYDIAQAGDGHGQEDDEVVHVELGGAGQ